MSIKTIVAIGAVLRETTKLLFGAAPSGPDDHWLADFQRDDLGIAQRVASALALFVVLIAAYATRLAAIGVSIAIAISVSVARRCPFRPAQTWAAP